MSKVLVVDDDERIREDLKKHLGKKGYIVQTASTAAEARKYIRCEEFDYAIIDLKLDFMASEYGGIKVATFAKRNQPKLKTIILSGYPFDGAKEGFKFELKGEDEPEKKFKEFEENYIYKGVGNNYIIAVLEKLVELAQKREEKNCFVIMPFSETASCSKAKWTKVFKDVIKPAVEKSGFNYRCERANIHFGSIIDGILDRLNRSELVIADITDRNPNVLYELGVRHTLGGPAIVIAQNEDDIPFDLTPYPFTIYGLKSKREKDAFSEEIKNAIADLEQNPQKAASPVRKYLDHIDADSR